MMCTFQILAKATATALLAVTNSTWLLGYFAADHGLHLAWRIAQGDMVYYAPAPAALTYTVAPLFRVMQVSAKRAQVTLAFPLHLL
jgi:hypothetical protein